MAAVSAQGNVDIYVNAHGDDTPLFMGRSLMHTVKASRNAGHRVILITTTAGDAGSGSSNGVGTAPTYLARELGIANVLQFLWGSFGATQAKIHSQMTNIAGKNVYRAQISEQNHAGYLAWYNIRLPDGNLQGQGYPTTQSQSLLRLEVGEIPQITAVNQSATFDILPPLSRCSSGGF